MTNLVENDANAADCTAAPHTERTLALIALSAAALFCAGFLTFSAVPGWAPRMAALLFVLPVGLWAFARTLRERDAAGTVLLIGLGWCFVVSWFHTATGVRLLGMIGLEASVLIYVGAGACWALGRALDPATGRRLLPWVVIGACAVSGVFGVLQVVLQVDSGALVLDDGRAHGLTTYSIYFGSLSSCALVLLAALKLPRRLWWAQLAGVFGFAVASGLSGSRAALGASLLGIAYLAYRRRDALTAGAAALIVIGNVVATLLTDVAERSSSLSAGTGGDSPPVPGGDGGSSLQRLGSSGGLSWRIDAWKAGLDAWTERPLIGWGVGNFRQAVQADVGPGFEQAAPRFDAHNLFVELLTTIGLPGLLLFTAFGVLCVRSARGPLALGALTLALSWLLQPAGLSTLPLAMLLLGASMPLVRANNCQGRATSRSTDLLAAVGLLMIVGFAALDLTYSRAADAGDPDALESIAVAYPFDPVYADAVAQAWMFEVRDLFRGSNTPLAAFEEASDETIMWSERAVDRQPDAPRWYDALARRNAQLGRFDDAIAAVEKALELQPRRAESQRLLAQIEEWAAETNGDS